MSTPVETILPSTPATQAKEAMKRQGIHHLVVASGNDVVGVISARDLLRVPPAVTAGELVHGDTATASPRTTIREAANLMRGRTVGCLPVVEDGRVIGIVTISDLLELIGRGVERPTPMPDGRTLRGRGPRKARPTADRRGLQYGR